MERKFENVNAIILLSTNEGHTKCFEKAVYSKIKTKVVLMTWKRYEASLPLLLLFLVYCIKQIDSMLP